MGASKSKSAKVAAYDEENDTGPTDSRKRNLMNKGAGRLEGRKPSSSEDDAVPRDNLSSAPSTRSGASLPAVTSPAVKRTHSAPRWSRPEEATGDRASAGSQARPKAAAGTPGEQSKEGKRVPPQSQLNRLGEYVIEGPNTAEQIDEYLANVLGPACAKNLRSAGLELLSSLLHGGREMQVQEPLPLYKASVTVLARALQDKVVPVFLPALQLLVDVYSDAFLSKLPSGMPLDPLPLFARQLVLRSGSSNVRAKEESIGALIQLARSAHVGSAELAVYVLQPLAKGKEKSVHAALGRLELLHALVIKHGFSPEHGFGVAAVLPFVLPLCSSASDRTRDAATALLREAYSEYPAMLTYAEASMPEAVPLITRLHERTDGTASQKKEKPSLAQFKQAHEPFARKQALPGISGAGGSNLGTHGATGATAATGATGGSRPAGAVRGDFIHISNTPRSKKGAEMREMAEIDELLQEYGLE